MHFVPKIVYIIYIVRTIIGCVGVKLARFFFIEKLLVIFTFPPHIPVFTPDSNLSLQYPPVYEVSVG